MYAGQAWLVCWCVVCCVGGVLTTPCMQSSGAILVFLPGWDDIMRVRDTLRVRHSCSEARARPVVWGCVGLCGLCGLTATLHLCP